MAKTEPDLVNAGEQPSNTPEFTQTRDDSLASVNRRLGRIFDAIDRQAKPPLISAGNLIALLPALLVLAMAVVGAFALSDRIRFVDEHLERVQDKIGQKLDRIADQLHISVKEKRLLKIG